MILFLIIEYYLKYKIFGSEIIYPKVNHSGLNYTFEYPCTSEIDCFPYEIILSPGAYLFELWGSQGCDSIPFDGYSGAIGGRGGYSRGVLATFVSKKIYIYLGGIGSSSNLESSPGGYNGGGTAGQYAASGGGASDIRLVGGFWNNTGSLQTRLIVAGGGGGARGGSYQLNGGSAGGLIGFHGVRSSESYGLACIGTQNGCLNETESSNSYPNIPGGFGWGGGTTIDRYASGGGGYYGGGAVYTAGGSGGSGYIQSMLSWFNIQSQCIDGNSQILEPNGSNSIGHTGHGYARVTLIQNDGYIIPSECALCRSFTMTPIILLFLGLVL